jgi:GTPase SAR1 family protein
MSVTAILTPEVVALLQRLSRFFVWRRSALVDQIRAHLSDAEHRQLALQTQYETLSAKASFTEARLDNESARTLDLQQTLDGVEATLVETQTALSATQATLGEVQEKFDLISRLLGAEPPDDEGLAHFHRALHEGYLNFANRAPSLAEQAQALLLLQSVERQLELLVHHPDIYSKKLIAIAGGFSSGKSEFINSFLCAPDIKLAVGIRPVTAIPTYVRHAATSAINAHAAAGGLIDLDAGLYKRISHDFLKSLSFDLKKILPFMSIATPMAGRHFSDICLIDTPGYNPPRTGGYTAGDMSTASTYAAQGDALIWVIGLDSTGTLVAGDLAFLRNLNLDGKELFIVANKVDLRAQSDIDDILDDIENVLADEGIEVVGISAYSSTRATEYEYRRESLEAFLARHNQTVDVGAKLYGVIDRAFDMHRNAIIRDIAETVKAQRTLKSMQLDLQQYASDELLNALNGRFLSLRHDARDAALRESLKNARTVKAQLKAAIYTTLRSVSVDLLGEGLGAEHFDDPAFEDIEALIQPSEQEDTLKSPLDGGRWGTMSATVAKAIKRLRSSTV